jgi:Serine dehydrogenase proteinase
VATASTAHDEGLPAVLAATEAIARLRNKPLLVLFYPVYVQMSEENIEHLYLLLRDTAQLSRREPLAEIDVLLQTYGGDPLPAYRLAQLVYAYARSATYLIPEYAYSAGTLMCLGSSEILLGDLGVLSPIDITLLSSSSNDDTEGTFPDEVGTDPAVELTSISHFIRVARDARVEIEREFRRLGWRNSRTDVEGALLCEMTRQVGVLKIAKYYREQNITYEYARELLGRMFGRTQADARHIRSVLRYLVYEAPAHEFSLDIHLCRSIGLAVKPMNEELSAATCELTTILSRRAAARDDDLFPRRGDSESRRPFFYYQPIPQVTEEPTIKRRKEATNGHEDVSLAEQPSGSHD